MDIIPPPAQSVIADSITRFPDPSSPGIAGAWVRIFSGTPDVARCRTDKYQNTFIDFHG